MVPLTEGVIREFGVFRCIGRGVRGKGRPPKGIILTI